MTTNEAIAYIEREYEDTAVDYAHVLKDLADRHFPHAKTIVLVQDNLNIHSKAPAAGMLWIDHRATPAARAAAGMVTSPRHIFAPAS